MARPDNSRCNAARGGSRVSPASLADRRSHELSASPTWLEARCFVNRADETGGNLARLGCGGVRRETREVQSIVVHKIEARLLVVPRRQGRPTAPEARRLSRFLNVGTLSGPEDQRMRGGYPDLETDGGAFT
jgi:hypothetical protein